MEGEGCGGRPAGPACPLLYRDLEVRVSTVTGSGPSSLYAMETPQGMALCDLVQGPAGDL